MKISTAAVSSLLVLLVSNDAAYAFTSSHSSSSQSLIRSNNISTKLDVCLDPFCFCEFDATDLLISNDVEDDATSDVMNQKKSKSKVNNQNGVPMNARYGPTRRRMLQQTTKTGAGAAGMMFLGGGTAQPAMAATSATAADVTQKKCFPNAFVNADFESALFSALSSKSIGFDAKNTLLATSFCPDEINGPFSDMLIKRYGESFPLGGLAGIPFVGASGLDAFLHHVPDRVSAGVDGKVLIVFAPHVGITDDGTIGKIQRSGQKGPTTACGAAVGAYKYIQKKQQERALQNDAAMKAAAANGQEPPEPSDAASMELMEDRVITDMMDGQEEYIINQLESRLKTIDQAVDPVAFITYQMYDIVKELLMAELDFVGDGLWKHTKNLAIVGGITINRSKQAGGDYFQPLMFELRQPGGSVKDLYEQTFGPRPNLVPIIGSTIPWGDNLAMNAFFPGALPIKAWDDKLYNLLSSPKYNFNSRNTLLASSICPDEINGPFVKLITNRYGENFPLGGLAGLPFVGKSGVDAFLHHVPDATAGKVVIVFAPHVAISSEGFVGKILRADQNNLSSACGAAVGAFKLLQAQAAISGSGKAEKKVFSIIDNQEEYIISMLENRLKDANNAPDPVAYLTYQVYDIIKEFMFAIFDRLGNGVWQETSEIIFAGGILINRPAKTGDYFMPLLLESRKAEGSTDIYEEAFGPKPNLSSILNTSKKS